MTLALALALALALVAVVLQYRAHHRRRPWWRADVPAGRLSPDRARARALPYPPPETRGPGRDQIEGAA